MAAAAPAIPFGHDAGSASGGGGFMGEIEGFFSNIGSRLKEALPYTALGATAGAMFPFIPGGPIGGAAIGAGLSLIAPNGHIKSTLIGAAAGGILGTLIPIIPGGPIGGALIGAALSMLF